MKKLLTLVLVAAMLLPCILTGCKSNQTPADTTPQSPSLEQTTPTATTPEATTPDTPDVTTPDQTTPDQPIVTPPVVTTLTLTTVQVTSGEDVTEISAAAELVAYLEKKGVTVAEDGFPISINIDPSIETDSFLIESVLEGENIGMTIRGGVGRDVLFGVYKFLEEYAGFRYFTATLETYTADPIVIPEGVVMEYTPVIGPRRLTWYGVYADYDWCVKNGVNFGVGLSEEQGGQRLNYGNLFVHTLGKLSDTTYPYPDYSSNPCMTDPEIFEAVLKNVRKELENNPGVNTVSISQNDVEYWCHCPNCTKIEEEEGSPSGPLLRFVNKIAEELVKDYPDIVVDTLAYKYTQTPPKVTKPHPNVCIRLCSITCCFTHAIDDPNCERNKKFCEDLRGWGKICDNVHIWDYTTDFHYYISTFANLFTIRDNMRFFADNNAVSMFPQGNSQGVSGEFGELRTYLLAKLMCDPYMSDEEYSNHMNEFLQAYYGDGWEYIRAFIDKTSELAANGGYKINKDETLGDAVCGQGIYDHPLTVITRQEYLNYELIFDEYWTLAKELAGNRREYVERSEMQWRLTKLYLHPNAEEAQKLIDDAKAAGVVWKEGNPNVQADSDLSLSPYFWKYGK